MRPDLVRPVVAKSRHPRRPKILIVKVRAEAMAEFENDDIGMQIAGEPRFGDGDRVLVFARRWEQTLRPVGMSQGTLPVARVAGHDLVSPGGGGLSLMQRATGGGLEPGAGALAHPTALTRVLESVRGALAN